MLLEQKVKVKWTGQIRKHYEEKGYIFTGGRKEFLVDVSELTNGSHALVRFVCDYCHGKIKQKINKNTNNINI